MTDFKGHPTEDTADCLTTEADGIASQDEPIAQEAFFASLDLPKTILKTLDSLGFAHPTPIQQKAIPPLLSGRDVVGIAQTGTGKTAERNESTGKKSR